MFGKAPVACEDVHQFVKMPWVAVSLGDRFHRQERARVGVFRDYWKGHIQVVWTDEKSVFMPFSYSFWCLKSLGFVVPTPFSFFGFRVLCRPVWIPFEPRACPCSIPFDGLFSQPQPGPLSGGIGGRPGE